MNDTYLIRTLNEKFVFRVYRTPWRSNYSEVGFEIDLLNHLFKNGVPVSTPIQAIDSEYIQEFFLRGISIN
ncbi:phosphotransferase [Paenibacillus sp. SYP-B4298]|uniref:phosphotransferase n=1 Tax=Paenibacillus sp. SYP-B4298 TaxID=2996034 RepID=UPI003FA78E18